MNMDEKTMSQPKNLDKKLVYPPGVKDITEDISTDDLVRRLKDCAQAFQSMNQDDDNSQYVSLALHLPVEYFMEHSSKDVRLLTACCIADVFRVFAPEAPYKDPNQLKTIFEYFVDQLQGLEKPKEPSFKRYFYLLENLSWVKTFNICLELEENQVILLRLFKLMFTLINEDHSVKVKSFILDMLTPLINEADAVSQDLFELILWQIIEPIKSRNKSACYLAQELLKRTSSTLEPYVQAFFNNALILAKVEQKGLALHLYELIYELNSIAPHLLVAVLPQLEFKLKHNDERERIQVSQVLAKLFSDKNSKVAVENKLLWHGFIGRFNDISAEVRINVVRTAINFLVNHPELHEDIIEQLKQRLHDADENVRFETVRTIISAARKDFSSINKELFDFIKERTLDKKFKIRKEALLGLATIYKEQEKALSLTSSALESVAWIRNKACHLYYQTSLEDRILVERILLTCLVPYHYPVNERMKKLYHLSTTVDDHAFRALKELLRCQNVLRNNLLKLVEHINQGGSRTSISAKAVALSRYLTEPTKAQGYIQKFCDELEVNHKLRNTMFLMLKGDVTCSEVEHSVKLALKILGVPSPSNPYYMTIKQLLERVAPIMIDKEGIQLLVSYVKDSLLGPGEIEAELDICNSGQRNLSLLHLLSTVFPKAFKQEDIYESLFLFLQSDDEVCVSHTLQILINVCSDIEKTFPEISAKLVPLLENFAETGTAKQAKYAVYCINSLVTDKETVFGNLIENLKKHCTLESQYFRTALISIGHIAFLCHNMFANQLKKMVAQVVVKDLLNLDQDFPRGGDHDWCPLESLPDETKVKIAGMKLMIRWLMGLRNAVQPMVSTLRLLSTIVLNGGDLMERQHTAPQENSWLRLTAATCILKLCQEPNYVDSLSVPQFLILASVMSDSCYEVRERFSQKLHKGLISMKLPLEFMSMFAFAGIEENKELKLTIKGHISSNVLRRREYLRQNPVPNEKLLLYLPDYVLPHAIYLLAHAPFYENHNDVSSLSKIQDCLWYLMEHLVTKNENYSFSFLKKVVENVKQTKDQQNPEDEEANLKIYAVSDLSMSLLLTKATHVLQDFPVEPILPSKLFTAPDKTKSNMKTYLPNEIVSQFSKKSKYDFGIYLEAETIKSEENGEGPSRPVSDSSKISRTRSNRRNRNASEYSVDDSCSEISVTTTASISSFETENKNDDYHELSTVYEANNEKDEFRKPRTTNRVPSTRNKSKIEHSSSNSIVVSETDTSVDSSSVESFPTTKRTNSRDTLSNACKDTSNSSALQRQRPTTRLRQKDASDKNSDDTLSLASNTSENTLNSSQDSASTNSLKDLHVSLRREDRDICRLLQENSTNKKNSAHAKPKANFHQNTINSYVTRQKRNENDEKDTSTVNHRSPVKSSNKQQTVETSASKQLRNQNEKVTSVPTKKVNTRSVKRTAEDISEVPSNIRRTTRQRDGLLTISKDSSSTSSQESSSRPKRKKA